jgi:hypothetical protein
MYKKVSTAIWHGKRDGSAKLNGGFYVKRLGNGDYDYDYKGHGQIKNEEWVVADWSYFPGYGWSENEVAPDYVQLMVQDNPKLKHTPWHEIEANIRRGLEWDNERGWTY